MHSLARGLVRAIARILGLGLMTLASACVANDITGTIVPPFPEGWKDQGGACIGSSLGPNSSCDYSIGVLEKPGQLILYIGKSAPRIDPKKAHWLVTDQIPYPKTPTGFQVVYSLCERDGKPDETIIAIVKNHRHRVVHDSEARIQGEFKYGPVRKNINQRCAMSQRRLGCMTPNTAYMDSPSSARN